MSTRPADSNAWPSRVVWYGNDEPLPERVQVRAGPLSATIEGGDLRYVYLGRDLVVLRLYAAVRDRNWNTIEPRYTHYDLEQHADSFRLRYAAANLGGDVDFAWQGVIAGSPDGTITARMDGEAQADFLRNRIGWCVLHPMNLAGIAAVTETPDGAVEGEFPDLISPHQPFFDMQSILHETPGGGRVTIRFEGDLWEMEDQRNWTDASYKTYSTPLRIPYPVQMQKGDRVRQTVSITAVGGLQESTQVPKAVSVSVDLAKATALPAIGLGAASHGAPLAAEDIDLLRLLRPAHLYLSLDLTSEAWRKDLQQAIEQGRELGAALALEVIADDEGGSLAALAEAVARAEAPLAFALVFGNGQLDTTGQILDVARRAFKDAGIDIAVGGGTRAYFTELNRGAQTLPLDRMDVVSYTINPQVHAFDNASLTETLAAQPETVRSARAFIGDRRLAIGPITLKPPFNPNATGPEPKPAPGQLPAAVDARQSSLFAAGWLVGSLNALGNAAVDALTYFETTGWRGVIERRDHPLRVGAFHSWPGMAFPIYHVLADVGEFREGEILGVKLDDGLRVQGLALRDAERMRVLLANMTGEPIDVVVRIPGAANISWRFLDDRTFTLAGSDPRTFRVLMQDTESVGGTVSVNVRPYAVATLDASIVA